MVIQMLRVLSEMTGKWRSILGWFPLVCILRLLLIQTHCCPEIEGMNTGNPVVDYT
jgi:hypothetical protein